MPGGVGRVLRGIAERGALRRAVPALAVAVLVLALATSGGPRLGVGSESGRGDGQNVEPQLAARGNRAAAQISPRATARATFTPRPTHTPTPTSTPPATPTASPTPTSTPTKTPTPTSSPAATATAPPTNTPAPPRAPATGLVLANYFAWYSADGWGACSISAGDRPARPYNSDDPGSIAAQLRQALDAGIDGFTLQWFAPGERTDGNLGKLLAQSQGTPFRSTVIYLRHIWPGSPAASQEEVVRAIRYLLDRYGGHPNFLTIDGRPVLFFTDMYRIAVAQGQTPQQAWAHVRSQADPQHAAWWIAEGLDPSYLEVFDGLYVYKIVHADYPEAYLKAPRWAAAVREWEQRTGQRKLWWGTITPGWDDTRSTCRTDIRVPSKPFKRDRADGAFYRSTFEAAMASRPDGLWVNSFNEWVEGTYVEPSALYGDRYLQLTRELATLFKGH